ncbi:MAG: hypothetical protein KC589_01825 [Nanoarchaeota archaeon]|nr:hypothetical protein [Nanoarchaeota archaeon]
MKIKNLNIVKQVLFCFIVLLILLFSSCEDEKKDIVKEDEVINSLNNNITFEDRIFPSDISGVNCIGPSFDGVWGDLEEKEINKGFDTLESDLPFGLIHVGNEWGLMFDEDGNYDWEEMDLHMKRIREMNGRASIVISGLESWPEEFDEDVLGEKFTAKYINFSKSLLNRYPDLIDYYWIDNEVNLALNNMEISAEKYLQYYNEIKLELSKSHQSVSVGIIITYPYESNDNALAEGEDKIYDLIKLAKNESLFGMTYYPQFLGLEAKEGAKKITLVDDMFKERNLRYGVIETGWSSKGYGSNPNNQKIFYENLVLESFKDNSTSREFLCTWGLYNPKLSAIQKTFFLISPGLSTWVENLGFFEEDGSKKPAWNAFRNSLNEVIVLNSN